MRRFLPVGSASLVLTLIAWGCASGERPPGEGETDASTSTETGPTPTGTGTGTPPPPTDGSVPPGQDAQADAGPAQPCVKNDDC